MVRVVQARQAAERVQNSQSTFTRYSVVNPDWAYVHLVCPKQNRQHGPEDTRPLEPLYLTSFSRSHEPSLPHALYKTNFLLVN